MFDLMIVDIFLSSESSGLAFVEKIKHLGIPTIICTGYPKDKYLDKAFEFGAIGFFAKPLDKAAFFYFLRNFILKARLIKQSTEYLTVKDGRKIRKIAQSDILFVRVEGNYCSIKMKDRKITVKRPLKHFREKLNKDLFVRCHRSAIVNIREIESLDSTGNEIFLHTGEKLPIGLAYKNKLKLRFLREG